MANQRNCCDELFKGFEWKDFKEANPLKCGGVYAIRINDEGKKPEIMVGKAKDLISSIGLKSSDSPLTNLINRLREINECPIIYIGRSKNMWRRYDRGLLGDGNHPAKFPIWILYYFGWKLEFGWKTSDNPKDEEDELKNEYRKAHGYKLPALMKR